MRWTPERDAMLVRLRREGRTLEQVARVMRSMTSAVATRSYMLRKRGVDIPDRTAQPPRWTREQDRRLVLLVDGGMSEADAARELGRTRTAAHERLHMLRAGGWYAQIVREADGRDGI